MGDLHSRSLEKVDSAYKAFAFWKVSKYSLDCWVSYLRISFPCQFVSYGFFMKMIAKRNLPQSPSVIYSTWYGHTSQDHFGSMIDEFPAWNSKTHQTPRMWWRNLTGWCWLFTFKFAIRIFFWKVSKYLLDCWVSYLRISFPCQFVSYGFFMKKIAKRKSLVKGERFIREFSKRIELLWFYNLKEILQNEKLTLSLLKFFNFG